ncbi:MAG: Bug family tripartite tricarboxylate transporter substrate binding protein [Xanthobacteraceae bacterium]
MGRLLARLLVATIAAAWCVPASAQTYPNRTVRVIIPLGAGGGGDIFTRALTDELQKRLGQTFIVENRPGGGLNIGTRACAEAAPDGYTICVLSSEPIVYNQFLFKMVPFNPEKDFEPITNLFFNTLAFAVNGALKVKTVPELIALAKSKPLSYSTFSFPLVHFMETLKRQNGIDLVRVPYRSGNEVVTAVLSGATPITLLGLSNMIPQIKSGRIVALAVNANARSPLFPDVPTLKEATGVSNPQSWFGLFAPAGTPKPIVARLHKEVASITADAAFHQKVFVDRAVERAVDAPDAFARFIKEDRATARRVVKESGAKPQ